MPVKWVVEYMREGENIPASLSFRLKRDAKSFVDWARRYGFIILNETKEGK